MSGFSYYAHNPHPDAPLTPVPSAEPQAEPPSWRKPLAIVVGVIAFATFGVAAYLAVNFGYARDLETAPTCVNGSYQVTWQAAPGTRFAYAELQSPQWGGGDGAITFDDNVVRLTLPGNLSGDVRVQLYTEDNTPLTAVSTKPLDGTCQ